MKRQCVLVPLDGSDLARAAIPFAAALARTHGTGIELLAVVDRLGTDAYADRMEALRAEALGDNLRGPAEDLRAQGFCVDICVRRGPPAETILSHADKRRIYAVVLSTHGFGGTDREAIGAVAERVIRLARCPVMAINPVGGVQRSRRSPVPPDGSAGATQTHPATQPLSIRV